MSVEHILSYLKRRQLENPGFLYALEGDGGNVFWADPTCRLNYSYFGDTLVFDTTYRNRKYQLPFAAFTGFNHHAQPVLFGSALDQVCGGGRHIHSDYKVDMDALDEAAKKVATSSNNKSLANYPAILELTAQLERTGQLCHVYRANLLSILRDMEQDKFQLSIKVQNARQSLKE